MQLPDNLKIFKDKIIACRDDREGIDLYWFNELIVLNSYIIYVSKHKKCLHVFSKKNHKLMYVRLDSDRININIESDSYESYISYYGDYRNSLAIIHKNKLSKLFFNDELKKFFNNKYSECTDFLALFDMDKYNSDNDEEQLKINKAWEDGYLLVNQFEYSLPFFINNLSDNEKFKRNIELINVKKKTNVYLLYQQYKRYLELRDETLSKYNTTQELLKLNKTDIGTRKFNVALKEMGFLTKIKCVNRNNWVIKGNGLGFGMNYTNSSSLMHIKIPDWYKISYFDYETLSLQYEYRYGLLKMTDILWEKSKFNDLLEIIKKYLLMPKRKEKIKLKKNIKRRTKKLKVVNPEREKWLKDVNCPYCNGKNIHKKDKRQRKDYQVQRYMCMDCKIIFQKTIEENQ